MTARFKVENIDLRLHRNVVLNSMGKWSKFSGSTEKYNIAKKNGIGNKLMFTEKIKILIKNYFYIFMSIL